MDRVETDCRLRTYKGDTCMNVAFLSNICTEGLNGIGTFYCYNPSTGAIYYRIRPCGISTAATGYWGSGTATATVATGTVTCTTFTVAGNYLALEYSNSATGAGSGIILQLSVW